ncbi:MAG: N-acyl homoserine lactonase family protein [Deltaproteobacteria bacterium]|nr:N-acyl homoserine lactonase family protein [Deltaproteobacteria bacterium]MBW2383646.1 N-acyl homoserine lactonase family protein [Deltaproteobacteria bacterium]
MTRRFAGPLIIVWIVGALAGSAGADAGQVDALRVHVLDCGSMRGIPTDELLADVPDAPEKIDMVSRCFLVEHPEGRLLWDTGLPDSFKYAMRRIVFSTMSFGRSGIDQGDALPDQLKELGLDEDDIDYLALSHIHWDHAGGANDFADATWIVQEKELEWAFTQRDVERPHVDPDLYAELEHSKKEVLSAADFYHNVLNREYRAPPSFNTDPEQTKRSMDRIEALISKRGAQLWIQHDPTSGPQAPTLAG